MYICTYIYEEQWILDLDLDLELDIYMIHSLCIYYLSKFIFFPWLRLPRRVLTQLLKERVMTRAPWVPPAPPTLCPQPPESSSPASPLFLRVPKKTVRTRRHADSYVAMPFYYFVTCVANPGSNGSKKKRSGRVAPLSVISLCLFMMFYFCCVYWLEWFQKNCPDTQLRGQLFRYAFLAVNTALS